ncbi:MAG TPA: sigma 54-interacting transcriptional regulator [Polyangiaceae bacterium]|jgi:transcriptional regulator with PAS, ATPase and Fis domain|nr:sigma 54-interacting transcriptional regulator [Polyangiaceae bacterium]
MIGQEEATRATAPIRVVKYSKVLVSVLEGPDKGKQLEAAGKSLSIGTAECNGLVLQDETVSRRHCELLPTAEGIQVRDEGSTNGSFIGGARVEAATFSAAFQLRLGQTLISVLPLDETVDREQTVASRFGDLLGASACMRELFADLTRIAPSNASVLIEGETGTGKELVAESIHKASSYANGPYVVFDCSAVPPTLVESELFGHERCAFTGAIASRPGVFEQAEGGTIFLDQLGELPKGLQPRLLRILEKREVRRVGSNRTTPINVRLVAASNRNLLEEVERGTFREDVFFRVAATHVYVPPLRDRLDDLPLLVSHFLSLARPPRQLQDIPDHVWDMFRAHRWPGNVRELQNAVQRLLITPERALNGHSQRSVVGPASAPVPLATARPKPLRVARREASDAFERSYLERLMAHTERNVTRGAAIAEVSRQMVQKLLRKHGL